MFRITKTAERSKTILTIDGQLSGDSVAAVETCCSQGEANGMEVQLYLRDVTSVDQAGQNLLSRLAARGIDVVASGVYNSYLVQVLKSPGKGPRHPDIDGNGSARAARSAK